jgi:hypothetical protein
MQWQNPGGVLILKGEMKGEHGRKPKITLVFIEEGIQG